MRMQWRADFLDRRVWGVVCLLAFVASHGFASAQAAASSQEKPAEPKAAMAGPPTSMPAPGEKAWGILREALEDSSADKRAKAVRALGLLPQNAEAEKSATDALADEKSNVRLAAAVALGSMRARGASAALEKALSDTEPIVVLAAANSLLLLNDDAGYDVYYAVLTGEKRANKGLIKEQLDTLKDKKKMAELGFEEGIGFIPFAGMGYEIFKTVTKDDSSPVRAAAAKKLAHDPNPESVEALVTAAGDKNWAVRAAALEAIAQRGDRSLLTRIAAALDDEKDVVRFTAAACVAHLSYAPAKKSGAKTPKQ